MVEPGQVQGEPAGRAELFAAQLRLELRRPLIVLDKQQMIDCYIQTLAKVVVRLINDKETTISVNGLETHLDLACLNSDRIGSAYHAVSRDIPCCWDSWDNKGFEHHDGGQCLILMNVRI